MGGCFDRFSLKSHPKIDRVCLCACVCLSVRACVRACLIAVCSRRPLSWNDCDVVAVVALPRLERQSQERRQTAVDVFFLER